jgi:hypothetical protein
MKRLLKPIVIWITDKGLFIEWVVTIILTGTIIYTLINLFK